MPYATSKTFKDQHFKVLIENKSFDGRVQCTCTIVHASNTNEIT